MGLVRGVARTAVVAGTASAVSGRVQRRQQNKWAAQDAAQQPQYAAPPPQQYAAPPPQQYAPPPPAPPAPESGSDDLVADLQRLQELRERGVITEEEFAAAKAKLLGA